MTDTPISRLKNNPASSMLSSIFCKPNRTMESASQVRDLSLLRGIECKYSQPFNSGGIPKKQNYAWMATTGRKCPP
jgi:hypothetical protein